jgi:hypothetical protein
MGGPKFQSLFNPLFIRGLPAAAGKSVVTFLSP